MMVRPLGAGDVEAVTAIARRCFGAAAWSSTRFAALAQDHAGSAAGTSRARRWGLVAGVPAGTPGAGYAVAGYVVMEAVLDEAELHALAVDPEWRRHGVGSALLRAALERATSSGAARVFLEVRESNLPARRLYTGHGFQAYARRAHYYRDPDESALLLCCPALPDRPLPGHEVP